MVRFPWPTFIEAHLKEIWKQVPGTDFEASSLGRLRRYITPYRHTNGYLSVKIGFGRKCKNKYVHRLVARAFLGPCPRGKEVHHLDSDKKNNAIKNLEYTSHAKNIRHMVSIGVGCIGRRGDKSHSAKLTNAEVARIRELAAEGYAQKWIAKSFSVSESHISKIVNGASRCVY